MSTWLRSEEDEARYKRQDEEPKITNARIASLKEEQSEPVGEEILPGDDGKEKRETMTKFLAFCTTDIPKEVSHIPHAYKPRHSPSILDAFLLCRSGHDERLHSRRPRHIFGPAIQTPNLCHPSQRCPIRLPLRLPQQSSI